MRDPKKQGVDRLMLGRDSLIIVLTCIQRKSGKTKYFEGFKAKLLNIQSGGKKPELFDLI